MAGAVDHCGLHARLTPDRLVARDLVSDRSFSYKQLNAAIGRFAGALRDRGVAVGDRVAMLSRNRIECVLLHLACARLGAMYVPLNWRLAKMELQALVADSEPFLVLGDDMLAGAGLKGVAIEAFAAEAMRNAPLAEIHIDPNRPSLILYTSGTSGRPKGALLSERNIEQTAINFSLLGRVTADSVFLCDAPMFHIIGIVTNIRAALMRGGAFLVSDGFIPAQTLERLTDPTLGVTHYFCVPQMAAALRAEPGFEPSRLGRLTALFTGGAPHPASSIHAWLDDGVPVADGFGMSEAGTVFGMPLALTLIRQRAGSAGIAVPGVQARLIDRHDRECAIGEEGELLIKGDNVASGYWRKPEQSADAFTGNQWFKTGDIARCDADGYYWIVDRRKDMFISGGENVYPAEIEAALADHPSVVECAVVGVPDNRWGEVGHLFVVARCAVNLADIQAYLDARLARYKIPKHLSVIDALPRNGAGKVLKRDLAEITKQGAA